MLRIRIVLRTLVSLAVSSILLLVVAGRWDWTWGWIYVIWSILAGAATQVALAWLRPELLAERLRSLEKPNAKPWDRWIVPVISFLGPLLVILVAGLDVRFGGTPALARWLPWVGLLGILTGYGLGTWALFVNQFFSGVVRIQTERGHRVVTGGPYRLVRHPAYAGNLIYYLSVPLLLGTLWAWIPAVLVSALMIVRTALEDRVLHAELDGYAEYASRVRYRLLPGVW